MMGAKTNKLAIQEGKKDYGKESAEETKETLQGDDEFDRGDEEFKAARARVQKRSRQGHARIKKGAWPYIRPE